LKIPPSLEEKFHDQFQNILLVFSKWTSKVLRVVSQVLLESGVEVVETSSKEETLSVIQEFSHYQNCAIAGILLDASDFRKHNEISSTSPDLNLNASSQEQISLELAEISQ